jgi:hypothetical protein
VGYITPYRAVVAVTFDPPEDAVGDGTVYWAKVKRFLQRGDFRAAQDKLFSATMRVTGGDEDKAEEATAETSGPVDTSAYQNEAVARALVEWNLTDDAGVLIPLGVVDPVSGPDATRYAAVNMLVERDFEKLVNAIEGVGKRKKPAAVKAADAAFPQASQRGADEPAEGTGA